MSKHDKQEQEKPLTPPTHFINSSIENSPFSREQATFPSRRCIKCCGCFSAVLLVVLTTMLVLTFTIFHIRNPTIEMNSIRLEGAHVLNNATNFRDVRLNMTLVADMLINNPNAASFKFRNTTTNVYYDNSIVGEARTPHDRARARRTYEMNVTVDVMVDRIVETPRFSTDFDVGLLPISTYTRIDGEVKITDVIKRIFVVTLNCTMDMNVHSQEVQDRNCTSRVSF